MVLDEDTGDQNKSYFWTPFYPQADLSGMTPEERDLLVRHGSFMEDLMTELFAPAKESHHHFTSMCKGKVEAEGVFEETWRKYRLEAIFGRLMHLNQVRLTDNPYSEAGADLPWDLSDIVRFVKGVAEYGHKASVAWLEEVGLSRDEIHLRKAPYSMSLRFWPRVRRESNDLLTSGGRLPGSYGRRDDKNC